MINDDRCEIDDSEYDKITVSDQIEWGGIVLYKFTGEVQLFRGVPCSAEIIKMERWFVDNQGIDSEDREDLALEEFPHFITKAAEKKLVEEL